MVAPGLAVVPAPGIALGRPRVSAPVSAAQDAYTPYRQQLRTAALEHREGPTLNLHPYQAEAVRKVLEGWRQNKHLDALVSLPTGTGKSEVALKIMDSFRDGKRILILAHRRQLVQQFADRICFRCPAWAPDVGTLVGGEGNLDRPITVATIQSLVGGRGRRLARLEMLLEHGPIDLLILDEAHHSAASDLKPKFCNEWIVEFDDVCYSWPLL
jgi:superfamily II DNA or RNA helicase